jgi:hypothetical protein
MLAATRAKMEIVVEKVRRENVPGELGIEYAATGNV